MKRIGLLKGAKLELPSLSLDGLGNTLLSPESETNIKLKHINTPTQSTANPTYDGTFSFRLLDGLIGGERSVTVAPDTNGYMPNDKSRPLSMVYSYDDETTGSRQWIGQSSMTARDFKKFNIQDASSEYPLSSIEGGRMFSYNGLLYFLTEARSTDGINRVRLYRWREDIEAFQIIYIFPESTDIMTNIFLYQKGSPDVIIINNEVYIVYRSYDRASKFNNISLYKGNEDLTDFPLYSRFSIPPSSDTSVFQSFRLRASYGDDMTMIVYYGTALLEYQGSSRTYTYNEMRSLVSFDNARTFTTNQKDIANIQLREVGDGIQTKLGSGAIHNLFINNVESNSQIYDLTGFDTNFALYYDEYLASFVIVKGGHPNQGNNKDKLIFIKTTKDSPFIWERCASVAINIDMTGDTVLPLDEFGDQASDNALFDPYLSPLDQSLGRYHIEDVEIVNDGPVKTILIYGYPKDPPYDNIVNETPAATAVAQFRFLDPTDVPPGNYQKITSYNATVDRNYILVMSPINKDYNGLQATATASERETYGSPVATLHKGSIWASERLDIDGVVGYGIMSVLKPASNLGENFGYEFAWSALTGELEEYNLRSTVNSAGSVTKFPDFYRIQSPDGSSNAYIEYYEPPASVIGTARFPTRAIKHGMFKIKMKFLFNELPSSTTRFLNTTMPFEGYSFSIWLTSSGALEFRNILGVTIATTATGFIVVGQKKELIVGHAEDNDKLVRFFAWDRTSLETWTPSLTSFPIVPRQVVPTNSFNQVINIGQFGLGEFPSLDLFELHIGVYEQNFRSTFERFYPNPPYETLARRVTNNETIYDYNTRPYKFYGNRFDTSDGSSFTIRGSKQNNNLEVWKVIPSRGLNNKSNLLDPISSNKFDFTDQYVLGNYQLILLNKSKEKLEGFSLINYQGIQSFEVTIGNYDEFTNSVIGGTPTFYEVPYKKIEVLSIDSAAQNVIIHDNYFEDHELEGHTIGVYDTVLNSYTDFLTVIKNHDEFIICQGPTGLGLIDKEYRIVQNSSSFQLDPDAFSIDSNAISITFQRLADSDSSIGYVMFGSLIDLSKYISVGSEDVTSATGNIESTYGHLFPESTYDGNHIIEYRFQCPTLLQNDDSYELVFNAVNRIALKQNPVTLIVSHTDGNQSLLGFLSDVATSNSGYNNDLNFSVVTQTFRRL